MNLVFSNAVLLPLLILVIVPLLIHLLARSKPPLYKFSSVDFILRIIRATRRIKRPQDWILLILRTLLYALLILLFLKPLFFPKSKLGNPFQGTHLVLVVDATASMGYMEGAQTRFASACAEASAILSGLSSRDTANIVWLDAAPDAVFPEMGVNFQYLQDALRRARVTSEAGATEESLRLAARLLDGKEGKREIYVLSDFQKTAWENIHPGDLPDDMDVIRIRIGQEPAVNIALTDVYGRSFNPLVGEEISFFCDIRNYSPQPARRRIFLNVEESRQSLDIMVPAWDKGTAVFRHRFREAGLFPVTVSLSEDAFAGDNQRWRIAEVRDFLPVGIVASEPAAAQVWRKALTALEWARVEMIPEQDLPSSSPVDVLMLSGWSGKAPDLLRKKLESGATLVVFPAADLPLARIRELTGTASNTAGIPGTARREEIREGVGIRITNDQDELFKLFASGQYGDPARGRFYSRLNIPATAVDGGRVLMAYEDGIPALVRFKDGGQLYLWNLALAPEAGHWAEQVEFLPLLAELLLTSRPEPATASLDFMSGMRPAWRSPGSLATASDVHLRDMEGQSLPVAEQTTAQGIHFMALNPPVPGLYRWEQLDKTLGYSTVNFPVIESDLRTLTDNEVRKTPGTLVVRGGESIQRLRQGINLWPYLLGAGVLLALLEAALLVWVERT